VTRFWFPHFPILQLTVGEGRELLVRSGLEPEPKLQHIVTRRFSDFLGLHEKLLGRYQNLAAGESLPQVIGMVSGIENHID